MPPLLLLLFLSSTLCFSPVQPDPPFTNSDSIYPFAECFCDSIVSPVPPSKSPLSTCYVQMFCFVRACMQSQPYSGYISVKMCLCVWAAHPSNITLHSDFSLLLNVTICQPSSLTSSSLPVPPIPPFLLLPPLPVLHFPAHPIWSLTPHYCSSFNEDLSPSHAPTCTRCSNTSHTELP